MKKARILTATLGTLVAALAPSAVAEEIFKERVTLPGAALEQLVTYSTTRADYNQVRDETLKRLRKGDASARVNPLSGPWKQVETTAEIGFVIDGIGASQGKVEKRQVTAAEEALFLFEQKE